MSELEQKIREIIERESGEVIENNSLRLAEDLGFDSLDKVDAAMAIEKEFNIWFEDEEIEKFITVQDVIDHTINKCK